MRENVTRWARVACAVAGLASCDGAIALAATTPFSGTPVALPGTIEAEKFDNGGEGIAYHDTTAGNAGGAYRATRTSTSKPPRKVATTSAGSAAGEWLNYTVNVAAAGTYTVTPARGLADGGASLHVGFNGREQRVEGPSRCRTPAAGRLDERVVPVTLGAGTQQMTLLFDTGGLNLRNVTVLLANGGGRGGGGLSSLSLGTPSRCQEPSRPQNFDNGGEGVAYHDTTSGNTGGAYRATDVDIEPASDGGYDVGWIAAGEWLNYTVNVASAGNYTVNLRVASAGGASMHVGFNNASNVWRVVSIPNTGGWQNWTTVSFTATLGAGTQQMTLLFDTAGLNIESINVTATASSPGPPPPPPSSTGGGVVTVNAGGDLQAAINNAQPGDTIVLQAGATFTGNFVLPDKSAART